MLVPTGQACDSKPSFAQPAPMGDPILAQPRTAKGSLRPSMTASAESQPFEPVSRPPRRVLRLFIVAAKVAITVGLLYLVLHSVNAERLKSRIQDVNLPLFVVAVVIVMVQIGLVSLRWNWVLRRLDGAGALSPGQALSMTMVGQFVNQFMPFAAGDAVRAVLAVRTGVRPRHAVSGVLIDRGLAVLVLLVIAAPPLFLSGLIDLAPAASQTLLIIIAVMLGGFFIVMAVSQRLIALGSRFRFTNPLAAVLEDVRCVLLHPRTLALTALVSLVVHLLSVVAIWILAVAVALPLSLVDVWALVPPMLLVAMLPFTVGGWGAREGVTVGFLAAAGFPVDGALLLSISFGAALLIAAIPGVVSWAKFLQTTR